MKRLRVLMLMEQVNPEWASVPLVGYNFWKSISALCDTVLVTHYRNREALEKVRDGRKIVYIREPEWVRRWYAWVHGTTSKKGVNWPLQHALSYPVYASFNRQAYDMYRAPVLRGEFDLVHAMTPILPRYPVKMVKACTQKVPLVLGPVNGGLPFPEGFSETARKEFAAFNFLRSGTRFIPGYAETYRNAELVLAGSSYTQGMLQERFDLPDDSLRLMFENGIREETLSGPRSGFARPGVLQALFVGRLVPYKGADMALRAVRMAREATGKDIRLTIVGDGSERAALEQLAAEQLPEEAVHFTGWIEQEKTADYYSQSDVFVFPSVREFGGAVALEAMAAGLPCVVADHGGIGEYVTSESGYKYPPHSREQLSYDVSQGLAEIAENEELWRKMSDAAREQAASFAWPRKAEQMLAFFEEALERRKGRGAE